MNFCHVFSVSFYPESAVETSDICKCPFAAFDALSTLIAGIAAVGNSASSISIKQESRPFILRDQ